MDIYKYRALLHEINWFNLINTLPYNRGNKLGGGQRVQTPTPLPHLTDFEKKKREMTVYDLTN